MDNWQRVGKVLQVTHNVSCTIFGHHTDERGFRERIHEDVRDFIRREWLKRRPMTAKERSSKEGILSWYIRTPERRKILAAAMCAPPPGDPTSKEELLGMAAEKGVYLDG